MLRYKRVYSLLDDTEWFYAVNVPNPGDHVYCDNKDPNSRGYGGSTLTFPLTDGTICSVKGPWHGSPDVMYDHTDIDLRNLHFSRLEIYHAVPVLNGDYPRHLRLGSPDNSKLTWGYFPRIQWIRGHIIYFEKEPVLGNFWRHEVLGHQFATTLNMNIYVDHYSEGGSSKELIRPNTEMHPLAVKELEHKVII